MSQGIAAIGVALAGLIFLAGIMALATSPVWGLILLLKWAFG